MEEKTEKIPDVVEESVTEVEDENPLKTKKPRKPFVMTEARKATLAKGRAKRMENIAKLQEEKLQKHIEKKAEKKKITEEVKEEVAKKISAKAKPQKKVKIVMTDSEEDSSSEEEYEIEIKKSGRKSKHTKEDDDDEEEQHQPPLRMYQAPTRNNIILV